MPFGFKIIESIHAIEQDGYEDKEIKVKRGGFWERIFDPDPTYHLWDDYKTKIIKTPHYKPVIMRLLDQFIVHPSLMPALRAALEKEQKPESNIFRW